MVYLNGHTVTNHSEAVLITWIVLTAIVVYGLPTLYNFYTLYRKANEPGWAAFVPIYTNVVYARIAKKPIELGVFMGLLSISVGGLSTTVRIIQFVAWLALGLAILPGFIRSYKAKGYQWALLLLFPLAASFMVNSFVYKGATATKIKKKKRRPESGWSNTF